MFPNRKSNGKERFLTESLSNKLQPPERALSWIDTSITITKKYEHQAQAKHVNNCSPAINSMCSCYCVHPPIITITIFLLTAVLLILSIILMIYRYFHVLLIEFIVSGHVSTESLKPHCVEIGVLCNLVRPTVSECNNVMSWKLATTTSK